MSAVAQENVVPLNFNGDLIKGEKLSPKSSANKTTSLTLPFFEDFTGYSSYPDNTFWTDREVYINNTMCVQPVSRGVATFDGLNGDGLPYNQSISSALVFADSLTSNYFNLDANIPDDSIYLSFFYQPQGNGFYPEIQDSLMLYFRKSNGAWVKVWSKQGSLLEPFKQVLIPLRDSAYLHDTFQFRFINKASLNTNDDIWNVDYIRLAAGRNMNDTLIDDVAFTINPSFMLNDYTYIPYRHFIADLNKERAAQHTVTVQNGYSNPQNINYSYVAKDEGSGSPLFSSATSSMSIAGNAATQLTFPMYTNTMPSTTFYNNYTFENKYIIQSISATDRKVNDTIVRSQIFHNYMAYDDGTAEKAYFLNLFPTLPGKTAIEYHLNQPDTIKGISIYFGRQVPLAYTKYFSVAVYKSIATTGGGSDQLVYQEDFLVPAYQRNDFTWTYQFANAVPMDAGTFYIGTIQPALSNSDSLYLGLDVNRIGGNHLYYNVVGYWQSSTIPGAVMIRPILGQIIPSGINDRIIQPVMFSVQPNPTTDKLQVCMPELVPAAYTISDMHGRSIRNGKVADKEYIDIHDLPSGIYIIKLNAADRVYQPQKIVKY